MIPRPPTSTLFPYTRSSDLNVLQFEPLVAIPQIRWAVEVEVPLDPAELVAIDRRRHHIEDPAARLVRSEEHTSELQSHVNLVCRLLLEKKKSKSIRPRHVTN